MSNSQNLNHSFVSKNGEYFCESVSLKELAKKYGTPLYVYSKAKLLSNCRQFKEAFTGHPTQICYAVKANDNLSLLKEIFSLGFGADVVSVGEVERVLKAGLNPQLIVFSGVGKTRAEIERAIQVGVGAINVESLSELNLIRQIAAEKHCQMSVNLRVNPNIKVDTNPYIATGLYETKFGIADEALLEVANQIKNDPWVSLEGLACHIGSQILELDSFNEACIRIKFLAEQLKNEGFPIRRVDLGGGLGISYQEDEKAPEVRDYGRVLTNNFKNSPFELCLEPGRAIIGNVGVLITRVIHIKQNRERHFTIVDAAMNDLIRPSLYEAHHDIVEVVSKNQDKVLTDVVGPICETGDFLGLNRMLENPTPGDLLLIKTAGAYGFTMASNYNSRPRAAEVLVSEDQVKVIRRRETLESLWAEEV